MHVNVNKILKLQTPVTQDFDCQQILLHQLSGHVYPENDKFMKNTTLTAFI